MRWSISPSPQLRGPLILDELDALQDRRHPDDEAYKSSRDSQNQAANVLR